MKTDIIRNTENGIRQFNARIQASNSTHHKSIISPVPLIESYYIDTSGLVNVIGSVVIDHETNQLPFHFGHVTGDFTWKDSRTTSLVGSPTEVDGNYSVSGMFIDSLRYCPRKVGGNFFCQGNFTSLNHCPEYVGGRALFDTSTLIHYIDTLPQHVGSDLVILSNSPVSFHDIYLVTAECRVGGYVTVNDGTHLLGLANIPGITKITLLQYHPNGGGLHTHRLDVIHDVFQWQELLLGKGLVKQAQL